ncbi:hypothetical protein L226DRAFT_243885 [Lentinus tigrinus ALCF2SS1-7]|uniref:Uncharacterized protein n=1 Tax=Lentinus tigrinus ALCF2SS1-6 TaxID=1328759 RepID=A0A5C2SP34_9APHY|nr:hypothetical protein L227DRAFT_210018 [Lentinus tigrinus ALCF2SS1-6]RPD79202.1 hypothetical protein L226DRAFT_243885 [Lentinus tigrinus ALCF2SS1-7]
MPVPIPIFATASLCRWLNDPFIFAILITRTRGIPNEARTALGLFMTFAISPLLQTLLVSLIILHCLPRKVSSRITSIMGCVAPTRGYNFKLHRFYSNNTYLAIRTVPYDYTNHLRLNLNLTVRTPCATHWSHESPPRPSVPARVRLPSPYAALHLLPFTKSSCPMYAVRSSTYCVRRLTYRTVHVYRDSVVSKFRTRTQLVVNVKHIVFPNLDSRCTYTKTRGLDRDSRVRRCTVTQ